MTSECGVDGTTTVSRSEITFQGLIHCSIFFSFIYFYVAGLDHGKHFVEF